MASRLQREEAQYTRDRMDQQARGLGHQLDWRPEPGCWRKGRAYRLVGTCVHCAGNVIAGVMHSSCTSVVDCRRDRCGGPGTYVLTEIEQNRCRELVADAVAEFGRAVVRSIAEQN